MIKDRQMKKPGVGMYIESQRSDLGGAGFTETLQCLQCGEAHYWK